MSLSMADRDGFIWFDGEIQPWRDVKTHVYRGPVLRHPTALIQAANFRSVAAIRSSRYWSARTWAGVR